MTKFIVTALYLTAHALSLYGYGNSFQRVVSSIRIASWPITIVLGMGIVIFLGGILNLVGLAYTWMLDTIVAVGLVMYFFTFRFSKLKQAFKQPANFKQSFLKDLPALALISATGIVADDFQKYFTYPLRMLQTGTLSGSPFNALGSETLGGEAFLQGFVVNHLPIQYINGFGLLFCVLLGMLILYEFGKRHALPIPITLLSLLLFVFINPQYVNISSLYSGSLLILSLIIFIADYPGLTNIDRKSGRFAGIVIGLFYSSLVILKPTFLLFIIPHFAFLLVGIGMATRDVRQVFRMAMTVASASALFVSPWLLMYFQQYSAAIGAASLTGNGLASPTLPAPNLFSTIPVKYGSSFAAYTLGVMLIMGCAAGAYFSKCRKLEGNANWAMFVGSCASIGVAYLLMMFIIAPHVGDRPVLRYFCPILIGALPAVFLVAARYISDEQSSVLRWGVIASLVAPLILMLGMYSSSAIDRMQKATDYGSMLAFPMNDFLIHNLISERKLNNARIHQTLERLQRIVPPEDKLLVWIWEPFYLNYTRNRILDVNIAGINTPWVNLPVTSDYDEIVKYFQLIGVQYILVNKEFLGKQYYNNNMRFAASPIENYRKVGITILRFIEMLNSLAEKENNIIFNDDVYMLLHISA
jgi:hypothetical protein